VLCTGGFQNAALIRDKLAQGYFDGVTIARALIANRDLPRIWATGQDLPERPCTHCNKCLVYAPSYPLGCYELARYGGDYDRMIREVYEVFDPLFKGPSLDERDRLPFRSRGHALNPVRRGLTPPVARNAR
jgi:hypothetical protein